MCIDTPKSTYKSWIGGGSFTGDSQNRTSRHPRVMVTSNSRTSVALALVLAHQHQHQNKAVPTRESTAPHGLLAAHLPLQNSANKPTQSARANAGRGFLAHLDLAPEPAPHLDRRCARGGSGEVFRRACRAERGARGRRERRGERRGVQPRRARGRTRTGTGASSGAILDMRVDVEVASVRLFFLFVVAGGRVQVESVRFWNVGLGSSRIGHEQWRDSLLPSPRSLAVAVPPAFQNERMPALLTGLMALLLLALTTNAQVAHLKAVSAEVQTPRSGIALYTRMAPAPVGARCRTRAGAVHRHRRRAAADMGVRRGEVPAAGGGMACNAGLAPALLAGGKRREAHEERTDEVAAWTRGCGAEEREREQLRGGRACAGLLAQTLRDDVGERTRVPVHAPRAVERWRVVVQDLRERAGRWVT